MELQCRWFVMVVTIVTGLLHQSVACPEACMCFQSGHRYLAACNNKNFTSIPSNIPSNTEELYFSGNQVHVLPQGALSKFENLKNLLMTNCEIREIQTNAFSGLANLNTLDLRWNNIRQLQSYLFSGLYKLQNLQLEHNDIETIENFAFYGLNLTRLGLDRNDKLKMISNKAFNNAKVEILGLQNSSLDGKVVKALQPLKSTLKELHWKNNQIPLELPEDAFEGFSFRILDLNDNGMKSTDFLEFVITDDLSLEHNPTGPIDFSRFPNLRQVRKLYLTNTSFSVVLSSYFHGMTHLTYLGLANNGITSLGEGLKPTFLRLQQLFIQGNSLHCNCELLWLKSWLESNPGTTINDGHVVMCETPSTGDITELDDNYLTCSSPRIVTISSTMNVSENEEVTLTCVGDGDPAPTIIWTSPDGQRVSIPPPYNRTFTDNQGIFHIRSTSAESRGIYRCTAANLAGNVSQEAHMDVYKPIPVSNHHAGSSCRTTSSDPIFFHLLLILTCIRLFQYL